MKGTCFRLMADQFSCQVPEDLEGLITDLDLPHESKWGVLWITDDLHNAIMAYQRRDGFAGMTLEDYLMRLGYAKSIPVDGADESD